MGLTVGAECEQHQRVSVSICDYGVCGALRNVGFFGLWGALFCGTVVVVTVRFFSYTFVLRDAIGAV